MNMVQFLFNDDLHTLTEVDPNTSVLEYVRAQRLSMGTKEGCASGDCGACTVVLAELCHEAPGLRYRSINACITPVCTLHGKQLITVEDLKQGDTLHPVQQTMVDYHASQCGFCTPGFVMSIFAYWKSNSDTQRHSVLEALGGNLCRCTGYRPIIDAVSAAFEMPREDSFSSALSQTVSQLKTIADEDLSLMFQAPGCSEATSKRYFSPISIKRLAMLLDTYPDARIVAGGTDLCLEFTQFLQDIPVLIYLGRVKELQSITESTSHIDIGAAVSYSDATQVLTKHFPDMAELLERLGSQQIRNQGTLAGNIANASPIGDMSPVLIALNAEITLVSHFGTRCLPVEDFFIAYKKTQLKQGEFIASIRIPLPEKNSIFRAYKISKRLDDDISAVCAVFNMRLVGEKVESMRIAFGGMAAIPKRASLLEKALQDKDWSEPTVHDAQRVMIEEFSPIDDFRASAEYRNQVAANLLLRFFYETTQPEQILRVTNYA